MSRVWRTVQAAEVARIEIGGTPPREIPAFWSDSEAGIPWASISDLNSREVDETAEYISALGVRASNVKLVPAGTPVMSFKLTVGRTSITHRDLYTNEAIAAFFVDPTQVDPRFLFHVLPRSARNVIADVAIKGATLNKKSLASMPLLLPPLQQQRRIAEILDAVDEQIRITECAMAKAGSIHFGLMQDLLGGRNGAVARHQDISELADTYAGATPSRSIPQFYGGSIPWVKSGEVNRPSIDWTEERITTAALQSSSVRWVPPHVPIVAMYGATAGVVSWTQIRVTTNQAVLAVVPRSKEVNSRWLYWMLKYVSPQMLARVQGSGQPNLSKSIIDRQSLSVPAADVQEEVARILDAANTRMTTEASVLLKLEKEKMGLASDLLSGRVLVSTRAAS